MLAARPIARIDAKRRTVIDPRKKQFAKAQWQEHDYTHRMNFYALPPTGDVTLEQFEEWAIARLKGNLLLELPHSQEHVTDKSSNSPRRVRSLPIP